MALHPQCRYILERLAQSEVSPMDLPPPELRQLMESGKELLAPFAPPVTLAAVEDRAIAGPGGALPIRVYRPDGGSPTAAVIFFHGGGFVVGSLDSHDTICRVLADRAGATVVSVGYRLAPEHPFPAAVDDAVAAVRWVAASGAEIGVDGSRLAVCGDSAGGNLAAVTSLLARDAGGPDLCCQVLVYPALDDKRDFPSIDENGAGYGYEAPLMRRFRSHYVPERDETTWRDPRLAPLRAPSLVDLPPALVLTAEHDMLRDEGEAYVERLAESGVAVAHHRYEGMIHGFWSYLGLIDAATDAMNSVASTLRSSLAPSQTSG